MLSFCHLCLAIAATAGYLLEWELGVGAKGSAERFMQWQDMSRLDSGHAIELGQLSLWLVIWPFDNIEFGQSGQSVVH